MRAATRLDHGTSDIGRLNARSRRTGTRAILAGVAVLAALLGGATLISGQKQPTPLGNVGGAPPYESNQPFLDWPQTGDLQCEKEFGPCGPPMAELDPAAKALGQPLRIAKLVVAVGGEGRHELEIGKLVLPNGIHSRTFFRIVNGDPKLYRVAQTHVEFRSLVPGAPPFTEMARNRPPVKGAEPVAAVLVWDVHWAADEAMMEIADLEIE